MWINALEFWRILIVFLLFSIDYMPSFSIRATLSKSTPDTPSNATGNYLTTIAFPRPRGSETASVFLLTI